jgi:hypothetical protein
LVPSDIYETQFYTSSLRSNRSYTPVSLYRVQTGRTHHQTTIQREQNVLSQEDKSKLTPQEIAAAWRDAAIAAKGLAQQMIRYERNEDPHEERNALNPAHGVRIRLLRPQPVSVTWGDADAVKAHNDYVSSLGAKGTRFGS